MRFNVSDIITHLIERSQEGGGDFTRISGYRLISNTVPTVLYIPYTPLYVRTYINPDIQDNTPLDQISWYRLVYTGKIESSIAKPRYLVWGSEENVGDT